MSGTHRKAATLSLFHFSWLLSRMLLLRPAVGRFRLCQRRRPAARVAGLLGVSFFPTAGIASIPAGRVMWCQRLLWPTTRRRAPRSECPLHSKYRPLILVAHAGAHRRQIPPPIFAAKFVRFYAAANAIPCCWQSEAVGNRIQPRRSSLRTETPCRIRSCQDAFRPP